MFLLGVVFTVVLLLASLATPLRLAGFAERSPGSRMNWVKGVPASQLYFMEIARVSVDEWRYKWTAEHARLAAERVESLVRETHNLGVRTGFKYDRFNEAVAALSVALLSFALSAALIAFAAPSPSPSPPIELGFWHRLLLATIIAVYCGSQLLARVRSTRPAVEDSFPTDDLSRIRLRIVGDALFTVLVPATVGAMVLLRASNWYYVVAVAFLVAGCYVAYWLSSTPDRDPPGRDDPAAPAVSARRARRRRRIRRRRGVGILVALGYGTAACWFVAIDAYAGQLAVAVAGVLLLLVPTAISPVLNMRVRRREFLERQAMFKQRVLTDEETTGDAGLTKQVSDMAGVPDGFGESDTEPAVSGSLDEPLESR